MAKQNMKHDKKGSNDRAGASFKRWDLQHVPKSLLKCTLQQLFAHRTLRTKMNAKKKIVWKSENSLQIHQTKFRQGKETLTMVIGENEQTRIHELEYEQRLGYIAKDIVEAKTKCHETLVDLVKQYDEYFTGVHSFMAEFDSGLNPLNIDEDDPCAIPNMLTEAGLTSKANALKDVAFGKQLTVRLLNDEYEKWEAFNEAKNVSRVTKVKDLENKQRIHDNIEKMLGVEREEFRDQAHLNESLQFHVSAISEALQALMIAKESKKRESQKWYHIRRRHKNQKQKERSETQTENSPTPKETSFRSRSKEGEQGREEKEATRQERRNTERKKKRKKEWRQVKRNQNTIKDVAVSEPQVLHGDNIDEVPPHLSLLLMLGNKFVPFPDTKRFLSRLTKSVPHELEDLKRVLT